MRKTEMSTETEKCKETEKSVEPGGGSTEPKAVGRCSYLQDSDGDDADRCG